MAIKRILRYLKGTKDYCFWYKFGDNLDLKVFTDVDWEEILMIEKALVVGLSFLVKGWYLGQARRKLHIPIHSRRKICCNNSKLF